MLASARYRGLLLAAAACLVACGDDLPRAQADGITVMSYNLAQIDGDLRATAAAAAVAAARPDFLALEECVECDAWLPRALGDQLAVTAPRAGVAFAHDPARWSLEDSGVLSLGDDDDGWGERVAAWGRFARADGDGDGELYFYATHWCVTIRTPDDACTVDRQLEYAASLLAHLAGRLPAGLPVVVAGDLNVFDGFEDGPVIAYLTGAGLTDLFRALHPAGDATTFLGNSWAPSGRLDYLFSTAPVDVIEARIDPVADASDHYPVTATVRYPAHGLR